jgi:hypothetical protein
MHSSTPYHPHGVPIFPNMARLLLLAYKPKLAF